MTCKECYGVGVERLAAAGNEDAGFDGLQLFAATTGITRQQLLSCGNEPIEQEKADAYFAWIERRVSGEPLQYILGEWEFYSLPFYVGAGVLIPRGDTEILVDECLRLLEDIPAPRVADLCAGSGCVGISIGKHRPDASVVMVELSEQAAYYGKRNILRNQTTNVTLQMGDVFAGSDGYSQLDLIVSNPPYIPESDLAHLSKEVQQEPAMALNGGADGLDFYRSMIANWQNALKPTGMMAFEVGIHQADAVAQLLSATFSQVYIVPDLNQIPRVVLAIK